MIQSINSWIWVYLIIIIFQILQKMLHKTIEILQQYNAIKHVNLKNTSLYVIQKRPEAQFSFNKIQRFQLQASNQLSSQNIENINKDLTQAQIPAKLIQKKAVGQIAKNYSALKKVFAEQDAVLQHVLGQVLLVDVWATWCGPCQKPMQHNQDLLSQNQQKWKGKVRIVAVSVDQQKDLIKERVNSKGWNKIEHLTLLGWNGQHPLIKDFQIEGIPFVYLVDRSGKIAYLGHPFHINLQQKINELIQKQVQKQSIKVKKQVQQAPTKFQVNQGGLQKLLNEQILKEKFGQCYFFSSRTKVQVSIINGVLTQKIQVQVSTYQDTPQVITHFKTYFDVPGTLFKQNLVQFQKVPNYQNNPCADCKKMLTYPFYWCKWDQKPNALRCRECVQKQPTQKQNYYHYLKNSVFVPGKWERIPVKGFGKGTLPQKISDVQNPHYFGCNGCSTSPQGIGIARYICLGCRSDPNYKGDYVDLCYDCFQKYFNKDQQKIKTIDVQGHNSNHPLLRVLFNVKGYYDF